MRSAAAKLQMRTELIVTCTRSLYVRDMMFSLVHPPPPGLLALETSEIDVTRPLERHAGSFPATCNIDRARLIARHICSSAMGIIHDRLVAAKNSCV